jgi:hypothetical protein
VINEHIKKKAETDSPEKTLRLIFVIRTIETERIHNPYERKPLLSDCTNKYMARQVK